jgi:uncharacterized protein
MEKIIGIQLALMALAATGFYQWILNNVQIKKLVCNSDNKNTSNNRWHMFQRFSGFLILGFIPFLIGKIIAGNQFRYAGIPDSCLFYGIGSSIFISILLVVLNISLASREEYHVIFPYLKYNQWTFKLQLLSALTWIIYLVAYEFLLRGVLLFASAALMGSAWAILLNLVVYALMHISKGKQQVLACIPLGFVMCITVLATQSFAGAALIHISFAVSFESAVLYHKKLQKRKSPGIYSTTE